MGNYGVKDYMNNMKKAQYVINSCHLN